MYNYFLFKGAVSIPDFL